MSNTVSKSEVVNFLTDSEKEGRMIVLFANTKEMRQVNDIVSRELRESVSHVFDKTTKFSVTGSMIRNGNRKVFLGLNKDVELLESDYLLEEIKNYGENKE